MITKSLVSVEKPKCGSIDRNQDGLCQMPAGWGTSHPGSGYCKIHGGNVQENIAKADTYAYSPKMADKAQEFSNDPNIIDMRKEIGLLLAMLEDSIKSYEDAEPDSGQKVIAHEQILKTIALIIKIKKEFFDVIVAKQFVVTIQQLNDVKRQLAIILQESIEDETLLMKILNRIKGEVYVPQMTPPKISSRLNRK